MRNLNLISKHQALQILYLKHHVCTHMCLASGKLIQIAHLTFRELPI